MTRSKRFHGLLPAFPTALTQTGEIDKNGLKRISRHLLDNGATGLLPLGGTGEFTAFSLAERVQVVETCVEAAQNGTSCNESPAPVVAGVLCPGLGDAIDNARAFKAVGADGIMLIVPYYARNTQQYVRDYFARIRAAVDIDIILYDNPARSRFVMDPETIGQMAADGSIVGMKASNTDLYHFDQVMQCTGADFSALAGQDNLFAQQVSMGACGGVLTTAVLMPAIWAKIQDIAESGDFHQAWQIQRQMNRLMNTLFQEENPGPIRAALDLIGLPNGIPRAPIPSCSQGTRAALAEILNDLRHKGLLMN